jgi:hypothetical protein
MSPHRGLHALVATLVSVQALACASEEPAQAGVPMGAVGHGAAAGATAAPTAGSAANPGAAGTAAGAAASPTAGTLAPSPDGSAPRDAQAAADDAAVPSAADAAEPADAAAQGPVAIDPPVADDCITDVSAGDHTFRCQGISFQVMVDEHCTRFACGLIFEVHGASMTGDIMRTNTRLHELGAQAGYLVVHPTSSAGTWSWSTDPPILVDFMQRMVAAFHVDERRIHMTGFSMGAAMTFWFLCNHAGPLASVAPVTGASADQVVDVDSGDSCIQSIDASWQPRVPMLFMSGTMDSALSASAAMARTEGIVSRLGLTGGDEIESGNGYRRRRWTGDDAMVLDFLTHDYASSVLAGHCIPGGPVSDVIFACAGGELDWGQTVLQWFVERPRS